MQNGFSKKLELDGKYECTTPNTAQKFRFLQHLPKTRINFGLQSEFGSLNNYRT